jgi:hypothetical protein
VQELLVRWDG